MYEMYVECSHFDSWKETREHMSKEKERISKERKLNKIFPNEERTHFCLTR